MTENTNLSYKNKKLLLDFNFIIKSNINNYPYDKFVSRHLSRKVDFKLEQFFGIAKDSSIDDHFDTSILDEYDNGNSVTGNITYNVFHSYDNNGSKCYDLNVFVYTDIPEKLTLLEAITQVKEALKYRINKVLHYSLEHLDISEINLLVRKNEHPYENIESFNYVEEKGIPHYEPVKKLSEDFFEKNKYGEEYQILNQVNIEKLISLYENKIPKSLIKDSKYLYVLDIRSKKTERHVIEGFHLYLYNCILINDRLEYISLDDTFHDTNFTRNVFPKEVSIYSEFDFLSYHFDFFKNLKIDNVKYKNRFITKKQRILGSKEISGFSIKEDLQDKLNKANPDFEEIPLKEITNYLNGSKAINKKQLRFLIINNMDVSNVDTSNITDMSYLFHGLDYEFNFDINNWDVSNVINMSYMFATASRFNLPINKWNVSNVIDMSNMFSCAFKFNQSLKGWDTSSVKYIDFMFNHAYDFNQDINSLNFEKVKSFRNVFNCAKSLSEKYKKLELTKKKAFAPKKIRPIKISMANYLDKDFNEELKQTNENFFNLSTVKFKNLNQIHNLLNGKETITRDELRILVINGFDVTNVNISKIEDLSYMFADISIMTSNVENWNISNVKNISGLFWGLSTFNQDISRWNTSNVEEMNKTFFYCSSFNQNLNNWDVSNVFDMGGLFLGCKTFNQPLDKWNTSNVVYMDYMFYCCFKFNQSLNTWDFRNIKKIDFIFGNTKEFKQSISEWKLHIDFLNSIKDNFEKYIKKMFFYDLSGKPRTRLTDKVYSSIKNNWEKNALK